MSTICAISTPYGSGGIAVIRVSGTDAIALTDSLFHGHKSLLTAQANTIHYGTIARDNEVLDEVLVSVFRAPHSFTGEDVVEIACHGSLYIQQTLLQWLIDAGCEMAHAGEFTQRAFLNGRLDLAEAEAVADLIAAQTKAEKDLAINQLRGGISQELATLRARLLEFTSLVELELDFADHEELEFADRHQLTSLAQEIDAKLTALTGSFRAGNAIKQGIPVAIIGATNVGKSTLLNALVGEERAIVSDVQGTTRDTIEDTLVLGGILFRFIDTAGIRTTADKIESLGIERSLQAARKALIIINVIDAADPHDTLSDLPELEGKTIIRVFNKADVVIPEDLAQFTNLQTYKFTNHPHLTLSAKSGDVEVLKQALVAEAGKLFDTRNAVTISNTRHYEALVRALDAIRRVEQGLQEQLSGEFLSMDLQDCLTALGEITGQITSQEVLNNIFSHFCIGK